eukprot:8739352-Ditylum_brightwellii.AAC.1
MDTFLTKQVAMVNKVVESMKRELDERNTEVRYSNHWLMVYIRQHSDGQGSPFTKVHMNGSCAAHKNVP